MQRDPLWHLWADVLIHPQFGAPPSSSPVHKSERVCFCFFGGSEREKRQMSIWEQKKSTDPKGAQRWYEEFPKLFSAQPGVNKPLQERSNVNSWISIATNWQFAVSWPSQVFGGSAAGLHRLFNEAFLSFSPFICTNACWFWIVSKRVEKQFF